MRAPALSFLSGTCLVGLAIFAPAPAKSQPVSLGFGETNLDVVKEVGYRRERYRRPHLRYRYATRPYRYRPNYRYFGASPDRYFGVGPGSYECYGYDCNW